jgi:hypothetical protein
MNPDQRGSEPFVRPAEPGDEKFLAYRLRKEDQDECWALGVQPDTALIESVALSTSCFSIVRDHREVIGMFGCSRSAIQNDQLKIGNVWLLGSPGIQDIRYTFLKQCRHWTSVLHTDYDILWNWADSRNTVHVKWLKWLGFRIIQTSPIGVNKEEFHQFLRIKD